MKIDISALLQDSVGPLLWTPVDVSGAGITLTVTADGCIAYKLPGFVLAFFDFQYPNPVTGTLPALIGGLPFRSKPTTNAIGGSVVAASNATTIPNNWAVLPDSFTMQFVINGTAQNNSVMANVLARGAVIYPIPEA